MLYVMGILDTPVLDYGSRVVLLLMQMYTNMGDSIALQYGGSAAHNKMKHTTRAANGGEAIGGNQKKRSELVTSIRRYYSNSFSDGPKQDGAFLWSMVT